MSPTAARSTLAPSVPDDPELRERVLLPYREHCQYLRSATVRAEDGKVTASCEFSVGESYYIDSTGTSTRSSSTSATTRPRTT
jgi:hypothetical protein